ncbi:MAG: response regulator transcription factor [Leptolyngbya sp.]|nr:response regulator transcription factor [Candidatus Melainabacteria bacterium]
MTRLLIVDDHEETRVQARENLAQGELITIVGEAATSDEAWKLAKELLPDMVLLDLHLPGLIQTVDLIKRLVSLRNGKVVIFASQGKASEVQGLLDAGASGYVMKTDPPALLRMAIVMVQKGNKNVLTPNLPRHITHLSEDERHILSYITMRGKLKKAAERAGLTDEEFNHYIETLVEKLELEDADKLVKWAIKHGF